MTAAPCCSIVEVRFHLGENASDTAFVDSQDFLESSEETVNLLMQRARSLAGEQAVRRLVYKDDDGDWCTVNRVTLSDVVQFATPTEPGAPVGKIDLRIIVDEVIPKDTSKESDVVTDQACQELSQEEPAEVEVDGACEVGEQDSPSYETSDVLGKSLVHTNATSEGLGDTASDVIPKNIGEADDCTLEEYGDREAIQKLLEKMLECCKTEHTACSTDVQSDAQQDLQAQLEQMTAQLKEALDRAMAAEEATRQAEKVAAQAQADKTAAQAQAEKALRQAVAAEQSACNSELTAAKAQAELQAFKNSSAEQVKAAAEPITASARVISSAPLMLGIEAHEEKEARGDISSKSEAGDGGTCQTYRLGRLMMASGTAEAVPASAAVVVKNSGQVQWPVTAAVACTSGDCLGFPLLPLGPLQPGESAEVVMDLLVPARADPCSESSCWSFVDAATGTSLGPQLVLEMAWSAQ